MREPESNPKEGLLDPAWRILDGVIATAQNRLDLFRVEAKQEKIRLVEIILLTSTLVILISLAAAIATVALVFLIWRDGSLLWLSLIGGAYAIGACLTWRALRARLKSDAPFGGLADQLRKD